jgi:hypothetical protein
MWLPEYARQILCELEMIGIRYVSIALYRTSDLIENRVTIISRMVSSQPAFPNPQAVTPSAIPSPPIYWKTATISGQFRSCSDTGM